MDGFGASEEEGTKAGEEQASGKEAAASSTPMDDDGDEGTATGALRSSGAPGSLTGPGGATAAETAAADAAVDDLLADLGLPPASGSGSGSSQSAADASVASSGNGRSGEASSSSAASSSPVVSVDAPAGGASSSGTPPATTPTAVGLQEGPEWEQSLSRITAMGFPRTVAEGALRAASGDPDLAAQLLVGLQ